MKKKKNIKLKIKSEKGFTMQDLMIAAFVIVIFVGIISGMMYSVYKTNLKMDLTARMSMYAVQILEDIDKIAYEEVNSSLASKYIEQFSIPSGFYVDIQVSKYGEELENIQDVMKIVKLTISYTLQGETEEFVVQRLKIKEL